MRTRFSLLLLLAAFSSIFLITACDDDDNGSDELSGNVLINFNAAYDGADLAIQSEAYDYPDGSQLKVQLFQYYVSDLELIPADGSEAVALADILLVRYNDAQEDNIDSYEFNEIPVGTYTGIRYGLGVSPDLNAMNPSEFAADFVLNENEFWNDNVRYVFAKIEANVDLNGDGAFDTPVSYHMGNDGLYSTVTFATSITIDPNDDTTLDITADVQKALVAEDGSFQNFADEDQRVVHGGNQPIAADIWSRLTQQFVLMTR